MTSPKISNSVDTYGDESLQIKSIRNKIEVKDFLSINSRGYDELLCEELSSKFEVCDIVKATDPLFDVIKYAPYLTKDFDVVIIVWGTNYISQAESEVWK